MRKVALFAAFALSVAFLTTSSSVPASAQQQDFCALNKGTCLFMQGPAGQAAAAPAAAGKAAKKGGKKKK